MAKWEALLWETQESEYGSGAGPRREVCPGSDAWHSVGH